MRWTATHIFCMEEWAKDSNPQLNEKKTKQMLITCNVIPSLTVKGQTLERVRTFKLLGTRLNENLKCTDHVKKLVSSCHKVLSILRKIRNMHGSTASKKAISGKSHHLNFKVDYNRIVCYPLPAYLQEKVQRVRNVDASFSEEPLLHQTRLPKSRLAPTLEKTELHLLKFAYRAIHTNTWLEYLPLPLHDAKKNLRSSDTLQQLSLWRNIPFRTQQLNLLTAYPQT